MDVENYKYLINFYFSFFPIVYFFGIVVYDQNELYIEATKLRKLHGLAGHTHVLETRAQK